MSDAPQIRLRPWELSDKEPLIRYANNRNVSINLNDYFPYPYTSADADAWLAKAQAQNPATNFAIELDGEAVGGVGFLVQTDVHRLTAAIGYWLGEPFWDKGIATAALKQTTDYAFANFALERIQATVFEWNAASARVLEKAGYELEARLRRNIVKDGRIADSLVYARLRST